VRDYDTHFNVAPKRINFFQTLIYYRIQIVRRCDIINLPYRHRLYCMTENKIVLKFIAIHKVVVRYWPIAVQRLYYMR
jgi:hypothetical protein